MNKPKRKPSRVWYVVYCSFYDGEYRISGRVVSMHPLLWALRKSESCRTYTPLWWTEDLPKGMKKSAKEF